MPAGLLPLDQLTGGAIAAAIGSCRFRYAHETGLHDGIEGLLINAGVPTAMIRREVTLAKGNRIDFLIGGVGIEVKVAGVASAVWRQLGRYAASDRVAELILVTSQPQHLHPRLMQPTLSGKPVHCVRLANL